MDNSDEKNSNPRRQVDFHYVKSPLFRVIHVDGLIGSSTPSGNIHFSLYSERPAIPTKVSNFLETDGRLGKEVTREGRNGFIRELDVDVNLSVQTATVLRDWLSQKIDEVISRSQSAPDKLSG